MKGGLKILILIAVVMLLTSCNKEEKVAGEQMVITNYDQIEDMDGYLENFKTKMQDESLRGNEEYMSLADASWHLSSVANFDFANAAVAYDDMRFDTLRTRINVVDGNVSLIEMGKTYEELSRMTIKYRKSLTEVNPNFRFIGVNISKSGEVEVSYITTFGEGNRYYGDTVWFFSDQLTMDSICGEYFSVSTSYPANGVGMTELKRVLNLTATHEATNPVQSARVYYTYIVTSSFEHSDYIDPNGSNFYRNSRLYASTNTFSNPISYQNMCYALDSYAGLAYDNRPNGKCVVSYDLEFYVTGRQSQVGSHKMNVTYGIVHYTYY